MEKYFVRPDWIESDGSKNLEAECVSTNWQVTAGELKQLDSRFCGDGFLVIAEIVHYSMTRQRYVTAKG